MTGDADMRDFTKKRPEIWFKINGVELRAKPAIGLPTAQRVAKLNEVMEGASGTEKLAKVNDLFVLLLHKSSVSDFTEVMADEDEPVDTDQLTDMLNYVMEKQGLRPTEPSTASSPSPEDGKPGIPGADGVLPVA